MYSLLGSSLVSLLTVRGPRLCSGPGGTPGVSFCPAWQCQPRLGGEASCSSPCGAGRAQGGMQGGHRACPWECFPCWSFKAIMLGPQGCHGRGDQPQRPRWLEEPSTEIAFPCWRRGDDQQGRGLQTHRRRQLHRHHHAQGLTASVPTVPCPGQDPVMGTGCWPCSHQHSSCSPCLFSPSSPCCSTLECSRWFPFALLWL